MKVFIDVFEDLVISNSYKYQVFSLGHQKVQRSMAKWYDRTCVRNAPKAHTSSLEGRAQVELPLRQCPKDVLSQLDIFTKVNDFVWIRVFFSFFLGLVDL